MESWEEMLTASLDQARQSQNIKQQIEQRRQLAAQKLPLATKLLHGILDQARNTLNQYRIPPVNGLQSGGSGRLTFHKVEDGWFFPDNYCGIFLPAHRQGVYIDVTSLGAGYNKNFRITNGIVDDPYLYPAVVRGVPSGTAYGAEISNSTFVDTVSDEIDTSNHLVISGMSASCRQLYIKGTDQIIGIDHNGGDYTPYDLQQTLAWRIGQLIAGRQ